MTSRCPFVSASSAVPRPAASSSTGAGACVGALAPAPNQLDLGVLPGSDSPMPAGFDYSRAFASLDVAALRADLVAVMTTSQEWWPADYGHYGGLFIRMAWHSAGTYRTVDGSGGAGAGAQRFSPLDSWPDNANLDKARRLLWPLKKKYGAAISWADLMVYAGNVALEEMGFSTLGFAFGRPDVFTPPDTDWGPEAEPLADARHGQHDDDRVLDPSLAATQMGLIYVNPEGPNGVADPLAAAHDIRTTFARMSMNDEETVALIAGGHTFGKAHGAASPNVHVGPEPERADITAKGLGWQSSYKSGAGAHTVTSGLEGAWTPNPTQWDNAFFDMLFGYEWELSASPAGAQQWVPKGCAARDRVPDAHISGVSHTPMMLTTDLALRFDPAYNAISRKFHADPAAFADAFARAWFKLLHRDMGPTSRYLGPELPSQTFAWQDPVPAASPGSTINAADIADLKAAILGSGLSVPQLVRTAWAAASTYRDTDKRGGANGARIRLAPQKNWLVNDRADLATVLASLDALRLAFNGRNGNTVSLADLIVLGGAAAIEAAARAAGVTVTVPFTPGRCDATQDATDAEAFAVLEPTADGFRNFFGDAGHAPEVELVRKAAQLTLSPPEMAVLVGGLRVLGANAGASPAGVLTPTPGVLTNDFFINVLDDTIEWTTTGPNAFVGTDAATGAAVWTASRVDLIFASNSQLRALAEVYASDDGLDHFVTSFAAAWAKVMNLDRFDMRSSL